MRKEANLIHGTYELHLRTLRFCPKYFGEIQVSYTLSVDCNKGVWACAKYTVELLSFFHSLTCFLHFAMILLTFIIIFLQP